MAGNSFEDDVALEATPPSGRRTHGTAGGLPVLWRPDLDDAAGSRSWLDTLSTPNRSTLVDLESFAVEDLARRLCPDCEVPLPRELDDHHAELISVVGINGSGKTHFLGVGLSLATRADALRDAGCEAFTPIDDTSERLHQQYYAPLFRDQEVYAPTQVDGAVGRNPLSFKVSFRDHRTFVMMCHDISGEVLTDFRTRATMTPFVRRSSAMAFLVDPVEFDVVRASLEAHELGTVRSVHQTDLLSSCLSEMASQHTGTARPPVSIVVTKSDLFDRVPWIAAALAEPAPDAGDWVGGVRHHDQVVRDVLTRIGEKGLVDEADRYGPVTFHAVASLGASPRRGRVQDLRPRRGSDPLGVLMRRVAARRT